MSKANRNKGAKKPTNVVQSFESNERRRNLITFGVIGAVVLLMMGAVVWSVMSNRVEKNTELVAPTDVTEDYGIVYTAEDAGGEAAAEAPEDEIVIYEDFSCPFCAQFVAESNEMLQQMVKANEVSVEYRLVGFLDDGPVVNNHSKRAASASLCVREANDDAGWHKFHDWLYENQPEEGSAGPTNVEFAEGAKEIGLKVDEECIKSEKYVPWMQETTDVFNKSDIGGTPTVYVNGERVESSMLAVMEAVEKTEPKK